MKERKKVSFIAQYETHEGTHEKYKHNRKNKRLKARNTAFDQHNAATRNETESQHWFSAIAGATAMTKIGDTNV